MLTFDGKEIVNSVYRYPTTDYLVRSTIPSVMCGATHNNLNMLESS